MKLSENCSTSTEVQRNRLQQAQPEILNLPIVNLSSVEATQVEWLWYPYLPIGKLVLLDGDPSAGKTMLALSVCADVTAGRTVSTRVLGHKPANVLYLTGEDGLSDTIRPRFDSLGGDASRFCALAGGSVTLADVAKLENAIRSIRPVLMVVDPVQAFLPPGVDINKANQVRAVLKPIGELAERYDCTILMLRHLSKGQQSKAMYRGLGSIDFVAAARVALLAGCSPSDPDERALIVQKSNIGPTGTAIGYTIVGGRFEWTGTTDLTADSVVAPAQNGRRKTQREQVTDFLRAALANGPRPSKEVLDELKSLGFSDSTVQRSRDELDITSKQVGFHSPWMMELPERTNPNNGAS